MNLENNITLLIVVLAALIGEQLLSGLLVPSNMRDGDIELE